jgi:nicotinamide phosphoribosyltransferase
MRKSIIIDTDAYKITHYLQYPKGLTKLYSYGESRTGSKFAEVCFFGLDIIIQDHFMQKVTDEMIQEAEEECLSTFGTSKYFNRPVWEKVRDLGYLPIRIKAVKEGSVLPISNVLFTLESTEDWFATTLNSLETVLMHIWYPTTIATNSMYIYHDIKELINKSGGSDFLLPYMVHDFSMRGTTGHESGARAAAAHLIWFEGTDTMSGSRLIKDYYDYPGRAKSVWATEHSVATSFGPGDGEIEYVKHQLENAPSDMIVSLVSDSYDIYNFCENVIGNPIIKEMIINRPGRVVIRPDSGDPETVINKCLDILGNVFGVFHNDKGFKIINHNIGLLQGDGMDKESIHNLYESIIQNKWCTDNLVVGSGGGLMQVDMNRDTQRFAIKASYGEINGVGFNIQKDPKTASFKKSKTGMFKVNETNIDGIRKIETISSTNPNYDTCSDMLETVFENGKIIRKTNFSDILSKSREGEHMI